MRNFITLLIAVIISLLASQALALALSIGNDGVRPRATRRVTMSVRGSDIFANLPNLKTPTRCPNVQYPSARDEVVAVDDAGPQNCGRNADLQWDGPPSGVGRPKVVGYGASKGTFVTTQGFATSRGWANNVASFGANFLGFLY
ncbi:unnamed protein product [Sympodiomycopsis kandeliae]